MGQFVTKPHINLTNGRVHAHISLCEKASRAKQKTSLRESVNNSLFIYLFILALCQASAVSQLLDPPLACIYCIPVGKVPVVTSFDDVVPAAVSGIVVGNDVVLSVVFVTALVVSGERFARFLYIAYVQYLARL